jgi:hypothetical protein
LSGHDAVQTEGFPEQVYPLSTVQVAEQPFPDVVPPSSHASPDSTTPLPQTEAGVAGPIKRPRATGLFPTFTEVVTVLVAVAITEMLLLIEFATYTFVPAGFTATP